MIMEPNSKYSVGTLLSVFFLRFWLRTFLLLNSINVHSHLDTVQRVSCLALVVDAVTNTTELSRLATSVSVVKNTGPPELQGPQHVDAKLYI